MKIRNVENLAKIPKGSQLEETLWEKSDLKRASSRLTRVQMVILASDLIIMWLKVYKQCLNTLKVTKT